MAKITHRFGTARVFIDEQLGACDSVLDILERKGFTDYSTKGIASYFIFRYPVLNYTMFQGIKSLDAGCVYLEPEETSSLLPQEVSYWRPRLVTKNVPEDQAVNKVEELIKKSVFKVVGNAQTIGITLSGGLDSSLIAAIARRLFPTRRIFTYTCGFVGDDEFPFARLVAERFSDKHAEIVLDMNDFIGPRSLVPSLIKLKGAPLHPNELALAHAGLMARKDLCDVVLCGEGADDVFGGYGYNLRMYLNYQGEPKEFFRYVIENYRYFSREDIHQLLNSNFISEIENDVNVFEEEQCPAEPENKMLYFIQRLHTRGLIERAYNAMKYAGVRVAFPYLNEELVDFVNALPFSYKVRNNKDLYPDKIKELTYIQISDRYDTTKYILKVIGEKYLPHDIVHRKKKGFPVPFDQWFEKCNEWDLDNRVFRTKSLSGLSGWKKFMVINLNTFIEVFNSYRT